MSRFNSPLNQVRIAAPCPADWDSMFGDKRVRFCSQCELNVYNLSEMTSDEAELLINRAEGRLCVRFYRRRDGSIMTQNCPVGLRAIKRRVSRIASAVASTVVSFLAGLGLYGVVTEVRRHDPGYVAGEMVIDTSMLPTPPPQVATPPIDMVQGQWFVPPMRNSTVDAAKIALRLH